MTSTRQQRQLSRRDAVSQMRTTQKSNHGAAAYSRWINRPLGRQIAAISYVRGFGPNTVSVISGVFTFAGIALIALAAGNWIGSTAATLLLVIGYAFDAADGQLARLLGRANAGGEWLDHVLDSAKIVTIHLAVAIHLFTGANADRGAVLLIPVAFAAVSTVFFFGLILADMLRRIARLPTKPPGGAAPVLRSLVVLPSDYGLLCLVFLVLPVRAIFLGIYTVLLAINVIFLAAGSVRWFRELSNA